MSEWSKGFVAANGLDVFYQRTGPGSGKPPLVLLHGYTDNGSCWSRVAHGLEEHYDVIMPDARGHGKTRGPVADMRIDLLGEDAAALIGALGLEKPFLFGHSMGASTALAAVANHPGLIRAAVLEDPPFMPVYPIGTTPEEQRWIQEEKKGARAFQARPLAERLAQGRAESPRWSEEEIVPWAEAKGEYNPDIVDHRIQFRNYPWREGLKKADAPLLLVAAEAGKGGLVTIGIAHEAMNLAPRCEVAFIPDAGHSIHRDRYGETLRTVTEFLARM